MRALQSRQHSPAMPFNPMPVHGSISHVVQQTTFSGPLPHPQILKEFEETVPGSAERIITIFEDQARHRMALESKTITSDIRRSWGGLGAGYSIGVLVIVLGFVAIMHGHDAAGSVLATTGVSGLVGTFIYGTRLKKSERLDRAKIMAGKK
jgi:uncharacterized membrane protein